MAKSSVERYEQFQNDIDKFQREVDKAQGALDLQLKQLKEEFECDSLKEAEKLLKKMTKERDEAENKFEEALDEFEERWAETLEQTT